jgi:hypothetical protein
MNFSPTGEKPEIIKLQRSIASSGKRFILCYNKDKSFLQQEEYDPTTDPAGLLFGDKDKVYVSAIIEDTGPEKTIRVIEIAPDQVW